MATQFKVKPLVLTIASLLASNQMAYAAENEENTDKAEKSEETEVIEVQGFRGSILKSMFQKRNSGNVTDSIFAEDIGKSTDQNIADALSRVTGVSVQTEDGEGTKITVRGANPNQNVITMNGVQLTSSDFNQSVDLSTFSSDILSRIDVVKTPSADHEEGSLGATVNLFTTKPLDVKQNIRRLQLQGRYSDFSENNDYKISGSFSQKMLDDRFGVLFTGYMETNSVRRDQWDVSKWEVVDVPYASDLNGNQLVDTTALMATALKYSVYSNDRDRMGGTATFQFLPTDSSSISLDLTYSKMEKTDTNHSVTVRTRPDWENYIEGVPHSQQQIYLDGESTAYVPTFSDPAQDWWVVDTNTRTLVKAAQRYGDGGYGRVNGAEDVVNQVANFEWKQNVTDDLNFNVGVNYSNTHSTQPLPRYNLNLLNGFIGQADKGFAGPAGDPITGIQPAGYDCTSGACEMIFGNGVVSHQDPIQKFDSLAYTAFNPDDISAQSVNYFAVGDREVEDEIKTAFFDVDWHLDNFLGFVTKVEVGAKYSVRNKDVDDQNVQYKNLETPTTVLLYDAHGNITGERVIRKNASLSDIPAVNYASDESFPYDNFMEGLGIPMSAATDGWPLISATKLFNTAISNPDLTPQINKGQTRAAELKNSAAYLKFSFEPMEGLTGDVGVRYVKTELETSGHSQVKFTEDPVGRIYDPFLFRQLRNITNETCSSAWDSPNPAGQTARFNRLDGQGWDQNGTPDDFSDDVRIPATTYPCFDELTLRNNVQHWQMWRHIDVSTAEFYRFGDDPSVTEDRALNVFPTAGSNTYDMYLPSLNLNWAINNEFIARFATSKTMSRPNIDSLKPGFTYNEGFWGQPYTPKGSSLRMNNPKLMPQESVNLDLSLEWYFNSTSMAAVGLFYKDMTNFEEQENAIVYIDDLRHVDFENGYNLDDLVRTEKQIRADMENSDLVDGTGYQACMPARANIGDFNKDWFYDDSDLLNYCGLVTATKLRNGKGASIAGVEFSYSQTYDFLPGIWSGLGSQLNYTYQESETDPEPSEFDPDVMAPQFPRTWTPKHAYNATVFWEKFGHQLRLAYRGKSDELINRSWNQGALWREGSGTFDFSANYKVNQYLTIGFNALNLTDEPTRNYFTSRTLELGDTTVNSAGEVVNVPFDEGNVFENSDAPTNRTQMVQKTGRTYRLTLNVKF